MEVVVCDRKGTIWPEAKASNPTARRIGYLRVRNSPGGYYQPSVMVKVPLVQPDAPLAKLKVPFAIVPR